MSTSTLIVALTSSLLLAARALHAQGSTQTTSITLGGAARLAAERSAAADAARARSDQADSRASQERAALLPSLTNSAYVGARTYNTASLGIDIPAGSPLPFDPRGEVQGPVRTIDFRTQASQRLVDLPAVLRWRAAAADADAAHYAATSAADAAATRGATAYLQLLQAEARIAARAADSALAVELLDIARQQLAAGVGIALDATRAESQLADARARLIGARGDRERAVLQLRRELSLRSDAPISLADTLELPLASDAALGVGEADAIRTALEHRADFKAARANSQGAQLNARAARSERFPTIALYADRGTTGKDTDRLLGTYSYGVQVSVPLFDGLRLESKAAEERARHREAQAQAEDIRRQVETEVRSALITAATAREQVAAARVRLRVAEQEVSQARERFRNGVSGNADVITASMSLNGARDLLIDALTGYHLARVALASAQGSATSLP